MTVIIITVIVVHLFPLWNETLHNIRYQNEQVLRNDQGGMICDAIHMQ